MLSVWRALDPRRRVIVLLATVAVFAAVLGLSRLVSQPSMSLLYAGLQPSAAGDVIRALDQEGVKYQVRGSAVWVESTRRDALRMTLASQGLPANGTAGYELLDGLSGFGTTSQMFDAAYWRAKEGELARTIMASPDIRAARVHVSSTEPRQPFQPETRPTASVTVTTAQGSLPETQIKALKYLISSAVAGMKPADVAVIDSSGGLLEAGESTPGEGAHDALASRLKHNVERLLAARVGPGHAVVEISIARETQHESTVEKTFDPKGRVAISNDTQEKQNQSTGQNDGAVTVASNLPNGQAGPGGQPSKSSSTESHERTNYEVSQTRHEVVRGPGAVRRVTVAVLVDGIHSTDANGKPEWTARPPAELDALHDLVASAVGFDAKRGDVITIKSLAFVPPPNVGTAADGSLFGPMRFDPMTVIQLGVLALVALILGLFVLRPILLSARAGRRGDLPVPERNMLATLPADGGSEEVLTGEIDDGDGFASLPMVSSPAEFGAARGAADGLPSDPVARLRRLIEDRQSETVEILRNWMEDDQDQPEGAT